MKKLMLLLLVVLVLFACKKEVPREISPLIPSYIGTYTSTAGDTAYISQNGETYTKIRWCAMGNSGKIDIDSVLVFPDNTFTVNQLVRYNGRWEGINGTGSFGTNTSQFHLFLISGGILNFSGIKR